MIKSVEFKNFRNLDGKYYLNNSLNIIVGKNNSGKTNLLEGIKLAFSCITNEYFKISISDFYNSDDRNAIEINVELDVDAIASLNYINGNGEKKCGFKVIIRKTQSGRYVKELYYLSGSNIDMDILRDDENIPNLYFIPLVRIEDIYTAGLTAGISKFISSEEKYKSLIDESKGKIKEELKDKSEKFQELCKKFNENNMDIRLTDPKFTNERVYIVDGDKEHNFNIGSGYKSIANIMLNTLDEKFSIILIDEIENHLHPALIRTLIKELRNIKNTTIIATTHSSVVINEFKVQEIIDIDTKNIQVSDEIQKKLNMFLHPGRNELILADNVILVEGYTEEFLLKMYLNKNNYNWTVVNVDGVMFEPYIRLSVFLKKKTIVISDTDIALSDNKEMSSRFNNLKEICNENNVKIIEMDNTLETDLYNNGYLINCTDLLRTSEKHKDIFVAKEKMKTKIVERLLINNVDLDEWHVIKEIKDEFSGN